MSVGCMNNVHISFTCIAPHALVCLCCFSGFLFIDFKLHPTVVLLRIHTKLFLVTVILVILRIATSYKKGHHHYIHAPKPTVKCLFYVTV